MDHEHQSRRHKLGVVSGVYIPVCLNILSILMFLRFGSILGQIGLLGMLGLLFIAYSVDFVTTLSLSAIASNGEVKGGGAYYLISRSLGPEFGGSIGILFYLAQVLNTALNVVGLIDCLRLNLGSVMAQGYWWTYLFETGALLVCTLLCLAGSAMFAKASNALLAIMVISILSIPVSAIFLPSFNDPVSGIEFTGVSLTTLRSNLWPHFAGDEFNGAGTFRDLFGILFPATSGIFAGASMSGDLRNPSKDIPRGTLWAMLSTLISYVLVIISLASSTTHGTFLRNTNVIQETNVWPPIIFAGEFATCFFSALMGVIGSAKLMQALARDKLVPGISIFGKGTKKTDEPLLAIFLTYIVAQFAMFANLNQIATFISMGYQMTFFVMNLACFLLKIGSAPNFRPGFKFFSWQTAFAGSVLSAAAMFFIDETYATTAVSLLVTLFLLIHYLSPPKRWGDVSQNLIYHQVRKYLLRLKPEHIKFWRPQIILLINNPRKQTRLIQFCNSMKKGGLYILGHVIVTDDFSAGVTEAKLQQAAWTKYISEFSRIKAFVQLTMSPTITWGVRNLILSAGLGGMRPNIAVIGFYNLDDLRRSRPTLRISHQAPTSHAKSSQTTETKQPVRQRKRGDTSARLMEGFLPTDVIRTEEMMSVIDYLTILEDLALRYRLNVAVGKGFETLETPRKDGSNTKKYIDLWPIQMSAELSADGRNVLTTNFDTYTLILQLGYILDTVPAWKKVYQVRVLVFVEYESEVEEERGRVKALLEKLRIEAEVLVFWLASGDLGTYEAIIHGRFRDQETEKLVNDCLVGQEWWEELQKIRGTHEETSQPDMSSVLNVVESTSGRPGLYNPHSELPDPRDRRRASWAPLADFPKKPTVSQLVRLGVSMGIHTQNLAANVLDSSDTDVDGESDSDSSSSSGTLDGDFNDAASVANNGGLEALEPSRVPLLGAGRRMSHGDLFDRLKKPWKDRRSRKAGGPSAQQSYGAVSHDTGHSRNNGSEGRSSKRDDFLSVGTERSSHTTTPTLSRQNSSILKSSTARKFTSSLVPETRITSDDTGPQIMFAEDQARPGISRRSTPGTAALLSSKQPARNTIDDDNGGGPRTVCFVEPRYDGASSSPDKSRANSPARTGTGNGSGDVLLDIPELLSSYRLQHQQQQDDDAAEGGSSYSTQGLPLSFNDLPSRAQHLILNELMRQNSADTAVLFTTLPVPEENTCQSEEASLTYLSDVEVLCNGLPPMLLVLSNNMTVTVSL
ncbi:amino acid permease-domain-containing protein [Neurospora hispaniola]|uniref:Amino acid permease-domain-containing protein n=1 Tax=Neurospora hispaniola TaxID=588809 RepID=A0AAJ0MV30_9PEZI|nr:amino acid permease-domain-containing protein [Neurospora hispaniola]